MHSLHCGAAMTPLILLLLLHVHQFGRVEMQGNKGSCDFEKDMCGYEADLLFGPWMVNLQGRYVHIEGSSGNIQKVGTLSSPELHALGESCVRLVYQITGSDPGRLNMYFRPEGKSFDFLLWSASNPSDSWKIASIGVKNIAEKSKWRLTSLDTIRTIGGIPRCIVQADGTDCSQAEPVGSEVTKYNSAIKGHDFRMLRIECPVPYPAVVVSKSYSSSRPYFELFLLQIQAHLERFKAAVHEEIILEGIVNPDPRASIAVFEINITPGYCIECNFEENHLCGYNNRWNPNLNWLVGGGSVRDSPLLLPTDHTFDNEQGHYMYVDSIYAMRLHEVAQLMSPMTISVLSGCLSFHYQLEQKYSTLFVVYTKDRIGHYEELWQSNHSMHTWNLVKVNIKASHPFQLVFEVAFSSMIEGYVALDDISFSPQFCNNETALFFDPSVANCNFDQGLCNYTQNHIDDTKWTRLIRKPNPFRFGDHTSGKGGFLLSHAKFGYHQEYVAHLIGPLLLANFQYCLQFFYALNHFISEDALAVYIYDEMDQVLEKIWTIPKSPTGMWIQAEVNFQRLEPTKIVFVSVCKSFWNCGKVALDDIVVSQGDCQIPGGSWLVAPGKCNFDVDNCGFIQDHNDRSNWHRRTGSTPTSFTGPKGDHTTGVGHFMYIEASHMRHGFNARLLSWPLRGFTGKQCLTFFYHMYGIGTGSLNVYLKKENAPEILVWKRRGEQSISWMKASIEYQCEHRHQIVFEAIRGRSINSDIAIDDILFQNGPCQDSEESQALHPDSPNEQDWYSIYI